jgi:type II secretory pathway component PulF
MEKVYLMDRLKPQFKQVLKSKNQEYPALTSLLVEELESKEWVGDIIYTRWSDMRFFFEVISPYDCFYEFEKK